MLFSKKNKSNQIAKISNVKEKRDLFGRLPYLALRSVVDLHIVFQYSLLSQPPCFIHPDGSLRESKNSTIFHFLKDKVKTKSPSDVHTCIADGMFIVRSSNNLKNAAFCSSFARSILTKFLKCTKYCLDLCFDMYESPSINQRCSQKEKHEETKRLIVILHLVLNNPYPPILKLSFKFQSKNHIFYGF